MNLLVREEVCCDSSRKGMNDDACGVDVSLYVGSGDTVERLEMFEGRCCGDRTRMTGVEGAGVFEELGDVH